MLFATGQVTAAFQNFLLLIVGLQMLRKMKGNINASHTAWLGLHDFGNVYSG